MIDIGDLVGVQRSGEAKFVNGDSARAEVHFAGRETTLNIIDTNGSVGSPILQVIWVDLVDGRKLTFLENVRTTATIHHGGGGSVITYRPHYVLVGHSYVNEDLAVQELSFTTNDLAAIIYDFDAFSTDIAAHRGRIEEIVKDREAKIGRSTEIGDLPIIAYFTGKIDIFQTEADLLSIRAMHQPSYGPGGPGGIAIKNWIRLVLTFKPEVVLRRSISRLISVLRFLQIVAGRKQEVSKLQVRLKGATETEWHALYWCLSWSEEPKGESPHPADVLCNGGFDPEGFANLLANWLRTDEDAKDARVRFAGTFDSNAVQGADRLVGSSNVFDLLPSSRFGPAQQLTDAELQAKESAVRAFRAIEPSDVRDRALSDLGRLGHHNLKSRVLQRAQIVMKAIGSTLSGLDDVLRDAIDARNHFVHGTAVSESRARLFRECTPFYVRSLQLTFALAELLDCQWAAQDWMAQAKGGSHPFADFVGNFREELTLYLDRRQAIQ